MPLFPQENPKRKRGQSDQYRATRMMTTTSNAAISESARSNFFDLRVSVLSSIGDMIQSP
jgi:hypothetical protein